MPRGKIRQHPQQNYYYIRYYDPQNHPIDYRVFNNNIGNFRVDDKVSFTLNLQNQATNLAAVQRQYIIPGIQGNGLDVIQLGVKRATYANTQTALFAGGMPTVFGGDMNDGENAQQTAEREMNEEIGYDVGMNHPVLTQVHQENTRTNQGNIVTETCTFYTSPNVIPQNFVPVVPSTEVASTFFLHLDGITAAFNNARAVLQQICGIAGIVIADINNLTQQQTEFLNSATLNALIVLLQQHSAARYNLGLQHIQTATPAANANVAYVAARNEYTLGLQRAQAEQQAASANAAYMTGFNEYTQAWQQIQQTTLTASRQGTGAVVVAQGLANPPNNHPASAAGHNEYIAGWQQAHNNLGAAANTRAYMEGYRDYI